LEAAILCPDRRGNRRSGFVSIARYPVMGRDVSADEEPTEIETAELTPPQIVNLDDWFVPVATLEPSEAEPSAALQALEIEKAEAGFSLPAFHFVRSAQPARGVDEIQLALDFG
jgi:hypothetical protein